jgi:hypothetical protein
MSDELFINVMTQLRSIEYSGAIAVHRYNEPLADITNALLRISSIRTFLPKARIELFTNGDYLTESVLLTLADIGVNSITATFHAPSPEMSFDLLTIKHKQAVEKLNTPYQYIVNDGTCSAFFIIGDLSLWYRAVDWAKGHASDRGGIISTINTHNRVEPCLTVFNDLQIEYDGTLLPCCSIHPDFDLHRKSILGKLSINTNIFVEWTNINYVNWRKKMISFADKNGPCAHCNSYLSIQDTPESRLMCESMCRMY